MELVCTWRTGPDAGGSHPLPPGRHVVGRAHTTDVRCDDPALQPHHALVEVGTDGTVRITQLTGRTPLRVAGHVVDGTAEVPLGAGVELGDSVLVVTEAPSPEPAATVRGDALVRSPRALAAHHPQLPTPPTPPSDDGERPGGLVPAVLGLAGAAAIAVLLHQPMFLLFGALGSVVALGSWAAQRQSTGRRRRRATAAFRDACADHEDALAAERDRFRLHCEVSAPGLDHALRTAQERTTALWNRRSSHPDAHLVALGRGDVAWHREVLADLPVAADLGRGCRVALRGPLALSVAHSLLVQLVTACGPADVRIVVVTHCPSTWECVRELPHLALPDGTVAITDEQGLSLVLAELGDAAHVLLVADHPALLAARTSPLRRALTEGRNGLLAVISSDDGVPHVCTSVLTTTSSPTARWVVDTRVTMLPAPVRVAGLGEHATRRVGAALGTLTDPEDPLAGAAGIPRELSLVGLLGAAACTPAGVAAVWAADGPDPSPRTLIGVAGDGLVDIDLVRDGPHGLIAGTTGAGKSELLRSLVAGMAATSSPAHLAFVLIDYKGGATFDACALLPHVVGVVTDLDDDLADRALRSLHAELRRREGVLRDHGVADLPSLRAVAPDVLLPRLVVVIDEFAALVAEQPVFLHALVGVAQRGRSLGVHLLLATQRPHGVISDDIRANTNLRLALRLHDVADAIDVVGDRTPAALPRGVPGRTVMRLGADEFVTFQAARCTGPAPAGSSELQELVRAVNEAARLTAAPPPPSPWQPALPVMLAPDAVPAAAVGLEDDPDHQAIVPLHWSPADGAVVIAGSPGSGVTATLHTLAVCALADPDTEVYVLDARGDRRFDDLVAHPRAEVVRLHERVRRLRLLHRLRAGSDRAVVLVVDGLDLVRRTLDEHDTADEHDAFEQLLTMADGPTVVAGVEHVPAVPSTFLARCPHRWVLHLHDPHDALMLGVAAAAVPAAVAGRVRVAATGRLAQLVQPGPPPTTTVHDHIRPVPPIGELPEVVAPDSLPHLTTGDGITRLPLGVEVVSGATAALPLPGGEHAVVLGPARSGRSSTLGLLTAAWRDANPGGWVGAVLPRRSAFDTSLVDRDGADTAVLAAAPEHGPLLVVVDDAELVDDPGGRIAALLAGRADATVLAAGRPEALRQLYGHWTAVVRRSRLGVVLTGGSDLDGDLLGVVLPRRAPLPARPGLAWVVADGAVTLTQVALHASGAVAAAVAR